MAQRIPLQNYPRYDVRVDLDGVEFVLEFQYLERSDRWLMHLYTSAGEPIKLGMSCLLSVRLLAGCTHEGRPVGELVFMDSAQSGVEAGLADFGTRVNLLYLSDAEVAELYG